MNKRAVSPAKAVPSPVTELTPIQRADLALNFEATKGQLAEMAKQSERITDLSSDAAYAECHSARMLLRNTRVAIEKAGKDARDDATKFAKAVIARENELVALIGPEEKRLKLLQDAVDKAKELAEQERAAAERKRQDEIHAKFAALKQLPAQAINKTVAEILELLTIAEAFDPSQFPEDLHAAARFERQMAINTLKAARDQREVADQNEAKLAEQMKRLAELEAAEEQRKAEAAQKEQDEANRIAAERAEADRLQREHEARERAEREAAEAAELERRRAAIADEERVAAAERAEADRVARVERERLAAEQAAEAQRLADEAKRLEEREIANASLLGAATEALPLLQTAYPKHKVTKKLAAAIAREPAQQKAA